MQKTHGEVRQVSGKRVASPEYRSWQMMRNRCLNPRAKDYAFYGAKGISICKRWDFFENFLADLGRRPGRDYTLERKNGARNYTPANCCWATRETQARNRAYAKTKAWLLAEQLGIKTATARHMIAEVRAKDRGDTSWFSLSPEREQIVRKFTEKHK